MIPQGVSGMSADTARDRPSPNSYWIIPARFAAGEYPGDWQSGKAASKIESLLRAGVDHFIDLTETRELEPYAGILEDVASRPGLSARHERHPIVDGRVPSSPEQMAEILDAIDSALGEGKTVYLHCWGGVGRTGTVVGCWLVRHGSTGEQALRQIGEWWQGVEKVRRKPSSPETSRTSGVCPQLDRVILGELDAGSGDLRHLAKSLGWYNYEVGTK